MAIEAVGLLAAIALAILALTFLAWRRYLRVADLVQEQRTPGDTDSLREDPGSNRLLNVPHQSGVRWLTEVFSRSAARYPDHTALQIPHSGESISYRELDARAQTIAAALAPQLSGPDQVVAVAMSQDNADIVAAHLGVLRAGAAFMLLDDSLPDSQIEHMLADAQPVVILTRGQDRYRELPALDVLTLTTPGEPVESPPWLDDPRARLASLFYTSGTTGLPKGVECAHAGYVNLALSYADYFDLTPGLDASTLSSSMGYDGSISEMYSAWVSGCSVVMLTREQLRSGPDLVPVLRDAEVTVLFCPPVLLTTLTPSPELDLPYPVCRYIVPAGEAFPPSLVEPWTRARRQIINTYGPTEASTDTSRQSLRPGEPVTIGSPFANVSYVVLEPGGLEPLPHGEAGELCVGGVHVARGYRNLPELTARSFIEHPRFGRLYRTGDLCRIDPVSGRTHFLGRADSQLKVRGHRVEVQPVEDRLQSQFPEIDSAVLDYQNQELVAFAIAPSLKADEAAAVSPAPADWTAAVRRALAEQLPAPSVPDRIFLVDAFVLKPTSGKIDRRRLPDLSSRSSGLTAAVGHTTHATVSAAAGTEPPQESHEILTICSEVFEAGPGWDDTFTDCGGHSIAIARLAQRLQSAGWPVTVRGLLSDCDTPRKVAALQRSAPSPEASTDSAAGEGATPGPGDPQASVVLPIPLFTTLQMLFLVLMYAPLLLGFLALVAFGEIGEFFMTAHLWQFAGVGLAMYLFALSLPFGNLAWAMLIKLAMGGHLYRNRVTPGVYPKWSRMHLRIWCIERLETTVLRPLRTMFRSAPLMAYALRRLGVRVGSNLQCAHDAEFLGPIDLITIEDNVTIQTGAIIAPSRWVGESLHVGPVHLGEGCKIGMRASVGNNVKVGPGAWVTPLTPVVDDVGEGELWEGAPARNTGRCTRLKRAQPPPYRYPLWWLESLNILMQVWLDFWLMVFPTALVTWVAAMFIPGSGTDLASDYFRLTPLADITLHMGVYAFASAWVTSLLISLLGCLFLRATPASPGLYPARGLKGALLMYRMKKMNEIQRLWTWTITGQYLRSLAGVRFSHTGASECDVMINLVPELVTADAHVFWAHGGLTNMLDEDAERFHLRQLELPDNFFSSNNSVAEAGHFPGNFLLGVSTPASDIGFRLQMRSRVGESITVAGNPPIRFAGQASDAGNQAARRPGFCLFLARVLLNDLLVIGALRVADGLAYVILYACLLRLGGDVLWSAALALVLAEFVMVFGCVVVKQLLVGSRWGEAHSTPFWSLRHFSYFFTQDCFFAWCRTPLRALAGTLPANGILRLMGCRIGRGTLLASPLQAFDWNAVNIGENCFVGGLLQFHSFEDMTLQVRETDIGSGSAINAGATVMGGARIGPGATLMPLSLVLKQMHLPTAPYWGSPAEPMPAPIRPAKPLTD